MDAVIIAIIVLGANYVITSWFQWFVEDSPTVWILENVKKKWVKTILKPLFWCGLCMTSLWGFAYCYFFTGYAFEIQVIPVLFMSAFFNTLFDAIVLRIEGN